MSKAENVRTQLLNASPLDMAKTLQKLELYDKKEAQQVIDEVYKDFETGKDKENNIIRPVMLSVVDSLMESCAPLRKLRKKGLTASRVVNDCMAFSYDVSQTHGLDVNAYDETKNMRDEMRYDSTIASAHTLSQQDSTYQKEYDGSARKYTNSSMEEYENNREVFDDNKRRTDYKAELNNGLGAAHDEYTGIEYDKSELNTDHIVPLARVQKQLQGNPFMNNEDVKNIANQDSNYAAFKNNLNQSKGAALNEEYVNDTKRMKTLADTLGLDPDNPKDAKKLERIKQEMVKQSQAAQEGINDAANKAVIDTLKGEGAVKVVLSEKEEAAYLDKAKADIAIAEKEKGKELSESEKQKITRVAKKQAETEKRKELQNEKRSEAVTNLGGAALSQSTDLAFGNLIMFIIKPISYELRDSFANGLKDGVDADSVAEAIRIRFNRVKDYVMEHVADFGITSMKELMKQFLLSFIEGIINCFVGAFKIILKALKEGIKIFIKACKIIWGKDNHYTEREKGDAILKLIGGAAASLTGFGIDYILNQPMFAFVPGFAKTVLSTLCAGILSALFMNFLDKIDLFAVKSERRRKAIEAIFEQRRREMEAATQAMDSTAIEVMAKQEMAFDEITSTILSHQDDISIISQKIQDLSKFFRIDLPYDNAEDFAIAYDGTKVLVIS